ncbi:MAG TPA: protein translocase subunit SecF [Candidatus Sulfotelmatobacter sp.]|nr:protein translocase subunit SecF [Candidatus Sulfotelmatobacter sp.]
MNIIGKKYFYFLISLIIIIPGIISLSLYKLDLSIEFTGGSRITYSLPKEATSENIQTIRNIFTQNKIKVSTIEKSKNLVFVRTQPLDQKEDVLVNSEIKTKLGDFKQIQYETVGPIIGSEITLNALKALIISSILIVLYITWSFRRVPKPASSFRFGIAAIVALIHDVLVLLGLFSILGHFFNVEVDSLFVTAILTVIGFSVHDTIVVFDRIRENLRRFGGENFSEVVNDSILQTLDRSLNTSLTVVLVLVSLLLFGGETIRWFVVALLIGVISGTYSSIFNASPLLVLWQEIIDKRFKK